MSREKENFDAEHTATIRKWQRQIEKNEATAEHAEERTKATLTKMLKSDLVRRGVANDMKNATQNRSNYNQEGGFGVYDDGEVITGFDKPWERD